MQTRENVKNWPEASDALIDEVGALLTESGGAQIIETVTPDHFAPTLKILD